MPSFSSQARAGAQACIARELKGGFAPSQEAVNKSHPAALLSCDPNGSLTRLRSNAHADADSKSGREAKRSAKVQGDADRTREPQQQHVSKAALWLGPEPQQEKEIKDTTAGKENTAPVCGPSVKKGPVLGYGPNGTPKAISKSNEVFVYEPSGLPRRQVQLPAYAPGMGSAILSYGPHGSPKKLRKGIYTREGLRRTAMTPAIDRFVGASRK